MRDRNHTQFETLQWHRMPIILTSIPRDHRKRPHPVEVLQAVIETIACRIHPTGTPHDKPMPIFHFKDRSFDFIAPPNQPISADILFFQSTPGEMEQWRQCLTDYFNQPHHQRTFQLLETGPIETRNLETLRDQTHTIPTHGELCLHFLSPYPFKPQPGKSRLVIDKTRFIHSFETRFTQLFGQPVHYNSHSDDFRLLPYYWHYTEIRHRSKSQPGGSQYIKGCAGKLYIKGNYPDFLPFLLLGSEIHCGGKRSNSQGYYRLLHPSPPHLDTLFPNKKKLQTTIAEVIDRYDDALESLSHTEMYPFDESAFAASLHHHLADREYSPSPNTAFTIDKIDGGERLVEQLSFKDLIVCRYLLKLLTPSLDALLEEESIGYRKGISRSKAVQMVRDAVADGFVYMMDADIENFFPSVPLDALEKCLDLLLPQQDVRIRELLHKILGTGYILNGRLKHRVKGLAQGNPLSPLLANVYLDAFDEAIKTMPVRLIRYGDDFIIFTRTQEDAQRVRSESESLLAGLGLEMDHEKSAVRCVNDGFEFLGFSFGPGGQITESPVEADLLKKPLYITEPYTYLSLNGDALAVKKDRKLLQSLPIRRISEIMVMEKSLFSTALLKRCTEDGIPVTITLNNGYYITTVKPDSKNYYDISFAHGAKYRSLSENEVLCIAKEFAAGKINNYIHLFRGKYKKGTNELLDRLYQFRDRVHGAAAVTAVMGIEGQAARVVYRHLNGLIDDSVFHISKRQRRRPDRINSLMNFGYYLLFSRINAAVRAVGLNPYLGFLHSPADNYESLVCDIQELFRARIDRLMIRMLNLKIITTDDFNETDRGFYLKRDGVKKYLSQFEKEMNHTDDKGNLPLKTHIYLQVAALKGWVTENRSLSFYQWE